MIKAWRGFVDLLEIWRDFIHLVLFLAAFKINVQAALFLLTEFLRAGALWDGVQRAFVVPRGALVVKDRSSWSDLMLDALLDVVLVALHLDPQGCRLGTPIRLRRRASSQFTRRLALVLQYCELVRLFSFFQDLAFVLDFGFPLFATDGAILIRRRRLGVVHLHDLCRVLAGRPIHPRGVLWRPSDWCLIRALHKAFVEVLLTEFHWILQRSLAVEGVVLLRQMLLSGTLWLAGLLASERVRLDS